MPVPSHDLDFQHNLPCSFICAFNDLRCEVGVQFADVGGIVTNLGLKFLFHNKTYISK